MNHPNYRGYDAVAGKPSIRIVSSEMAQSLDVLKKLPAHCPPEFLPKIEAVRLWCLHKGLRFSLSPYEWQVAKVFGDGFTIVLWNSRIKGPGRRRRIKLTFEGTDIPPDAEVVKDALTKLVDQ